VRAADPHIYAPALVGRLSAHAADRVFRIAIALAGAGLAGCLAAAGGELGGGVDGQTLGDAGQFDDPADCSARGDGQPQFGAAGGGLAAGLDQVLQAGGVAEAGAGQVGDDDGDAGRACGGDQVQDVAGVGEVDLGGSAMMTGMASSLMTGTDLLIPVRGMPEGSSRLGPGEPLVRIIPGCRGGWCPWANARTAGRSPGGVSGAWPGRELRAAHAAVRWHRKVLCGPAAAGAGGRRCWPVRPGGGR